MYTSSQDSAVYGTVVPCRLCRRSLNQPTNQVIQSLNPLVPSLVAFGGICPSLAGACVGRHWRRSQEASAIIGFARPAVMCGALLVLVLTTDYD